MADKKIRYEITADPAGFKKGFTEAAASTNMLDSSVKSLGRSVISLGATYLGAQGIGAIIKTADTYANLDSKLKLATKSSSEFASSYDALFKMSQKTGSSFEANVTAFSGLAMAMKGTKVPTEELLSVFEDVNKSLVVAGASTVEASSFLLQFKQALGSNRLSGDEFKAMLEANSYWAGQFAKALDTDMAGLYKMKEAQELTTEVVLNAHKRMAAGISSDFDQMEKTVARATMELSNAWKDVLADSNKSEQGTQKLATAISGLATTITENKETISTVFSGLIYGAKESIDFLARVTTGIRSLRVALHAPDKSVFDWMGADNNTRLDWIKESTTEAAQLKAIIVEIDSEIRTAQKAWSRGEVENGTVKALRQEKEAFVQRLKLIQDGSAAEDAAISKAIAGVEKRLGLEKQSTTSFKDSWQTKRDLTISMSKEITDAEAKAFAESDKLAQKAASDRKKTVEEQLALQASLVDKVKEGTLSEHDYKIWALDQELAKMRETAGGKQEIIDQIIEYEKIRLKEIGEVREKSLNEDFDNWLRVQMAIDEGNKTSADTFMVLEDMKKDGFKDTLKDMEKSNRHSLTEMERDWLDFTRDVKGDFSSTLSGFLKGEFNTLGDAWDSLTDRLLDSFIDMLADMAVAWAASEIASWFGYGSGGSFGFSVGGSGGGSGSGGGGASGTVGGLVTTAVGTAVKDYVWTNGVKPAATWAYDSVMGTAGTEAASGVGMEMGGSSAAGATIAVETGYFAGGGGAGVTGATSFGASEAAAAGYGGASATGTAAGAGGGGAAGGGAASGIAAGAGWAIGAVTVAAALGGLAYYWNKGNHNTRDRLNDANVTPAGFGMVGGIETDGQLVKLSEEMKDSLGLLKREFRSFDAASIDTANGVMVLTDNIVGEGGLVTGVNYSIETFIEATQTWEKSQVSFDDLLSTMSDMAPVSSDAISSTAQYVAEMAGVPAVADELAMAFLELQTGIYGVAGAAVSGAGSFAQAMSMIGGLTYNAGYSGDDDSDPNIPGSSAWMDSGGYSANRPTTADLGYDRDWSMNNQDGGMAAGGTVVPIGDDVWRGYKYGEVVLPVDTSQLLDRKLRNGSIDSGTIAAAIADLKEVVIGAIMASSEKMRKIENTVMRWEKIGLPAARA